MEQNSAFKCLFRPLVSVNTDGNILSNIITNSDFASIESYSLIINVY